jgi:hypothetical protein
MFMCFQRETCFCISQMLNVYVFSKGNMFLYFTNVKMFICFFCHPNMFLHLKTLWFLVLIELPRDTKSAAGLHGSPFKSAFVRRPLWPSPSTGCPKANVQCGMLLQMATTTECRFIRSGQ